MKIKNMAELSKNEQRQFLPQIREIFFSSAAVKTFANDSVRDAFYMRWCGDYYTLFPESFFLSVSQENIIQGYLCASYDTLGAMPRLQIPAMQIFADQYKAFPVHFHINTHPQFRSMGVGANLVNFLEKEVNKKNLPGMHIITSPEQRNISFYRRLHFTHLVERKATNENLLLFMGRQLP